MSDHHHMDHGMHDHAGGGADPHEGHDAHMRHVAELDTTTMDHSQHTDSTMHMGSSTMGGGGMNMMHMMSMYFHFGHDETILFDFWKISSLGGLIGSMVGIFFMAALYEGLKYYREYLFWKTYNALQYRSVEAPANKNTTPEENSVVQPSMLSLSHAFQTLLHIVQIVVSYFLMLIFMTYNVWLCVAVTVGAATGYFLFGWKKSVIIDVTEHCH